MPPTFISRHSSRHSIHPAPLSLLLALPLLVTGAVGCSASAEDPPRGPLGAADSLGSCAAGDFCGGPSDGNCFCDDQCVEVGDCCSDHAEVCLGEEPDETVTFEVTGYVLGTAAGNRADAEASWAAACTSWLDRLQSRFGPATATGCGEAENLFSSGFLFASRPTATLTAQVAPGGELIAAAPVRTAAGRSAGNLADALASWATACDEAIDELRALHGDRLAAASCPAPRNLFSSGFLQESEVHAWLTPLEGDRVTGIDYAAGGLHGNLEDALVSWRAACAGAVALAVDVAGADDLELAACEPRENLASSGFLFASEIAVRIAGDDPVASSPPPVNGASLGNLADALASWRTACDQALGAARDRDGERLAGAVCGVPENRASFGFQFQSQPTLWHHR